MKDMVIRTKFMKKLVSKMVTRYLKTKLNDPNVEVEIGEIAVKLGKEPRIRVNLMADISINDLIEIKDIDGIDVF